MSIVIQQLTKKYGKQKAIDDLTFSTEKGSITGFLGPNGAGKSTTMKIVTGYVGATSGKVIVQNVDVSVNPLKTKKIVGYLPEHNPLYIEMYVKEYLRFIGNIYQLKKIKNKVEEMIDLVGLRREQNKKISSLSKGYRQRLGLAQALIHDPSVLILDEPTSGLDPNQLVEIRKVIKEVSAEKTVIFSTHIMQEVEALCDRVIIINKGKKVADDEMNSLKKRFSKDATYHIEFESSIDTSLFKKIDPVNIIVKPLENNTYSISAPLDNLKEKIMKAVVDHHLPIVTIQKQAENTLEHVFQALTTS